MFTFQKDKLLIEHVVWNITKTNKLILPYTKTDEKWLLTPKTVEKRPHQEKFLRAMQIVYAFSLSTFSTEVAGVLSIKKPDQFLSRVIFTEHYGTTIHLVGKSLRYEFFNLDINKQSIDSIQTIYRSPC